MLTFTGTAASVLHPSHVMDYLGRGCCFARLHIQALPLTFQFILGDLINHFFSLLILTLRLLGRDCFSAVLVCIIQCHTHQCYPYRRQEAGEQPSVLLPDSFRTNSEQIIAGLRNFTQKAEQPLQGQQIVFYLGGLRGTTLAASANWNPGSAPGRH